MTCLSGNTSPHYLSASKLLISTMKSTVTLFTPDTHQFQTHPNITLKDTQLSLERSSKIVGVIMDPSLSFYKDWNYVTDRIDKRNNMLKALAGSSWGQHRETFSADLQRMGEIYRKLCCTSLEYQRKWLAAMRTVTGAHKMDSIDHIYQESLTLKVKDHSNIFSAQYLLNCLEEDHVCHVITTQEPRPRPTKETLHYRYHSTVLPGLGASRKEHLQNLHTHAVDSTIQLLCNKRVLKERPLPIADEEHRLNRKQRYTLSQLRSWHCHLSHDYKHRVLGEPSVICIEGGASPRDMRHLFACNAHPTDLSPEDLWQNEVGSFRTFS